MPPKKQTTLIQVVIFLILLQLSNFLLTTLAFLLIPHTLLTDKLISGTVNLFFILLILLCCYKVNIHLALLPKHFTLPYVLFSLIYVFLLISTPLVNQDLSFSNCYFLLYGALITPGYEEIIFRGWVWEKLEQHFKKRWTVYLICSLLFALWHLGYYPTIKWHVALRNPDADMANIMFFKCVTGLIYGLLVGVLPDLKVKTASSAFCCMGS